MTRNNLVAGLEILRPYMKRNDWLRREGNTSYVNVIFDEVEDEESEKLQALGWYAIDDYWGFEEDNEFVKHFNQWFDKQKSDLDMYTELHKYIEDLAFAAMSSGVAIGVFDSKLAKAALETTDGKNRI